MQYVIHPELGVIGHLDKDIDIGGKTFFKVRATERLPPYTSTEDFMAQDLDTTLGFIKRGRDWEVDSDHTAHKLLEEPRTRVGPATFYRGTRETPPSEGPLFQVRGAKIYDVKQILTEKSVCDTRDTYAGECLARYSEHAARKLARDAKC